MDAVFSSLGDPTRRGILARLSEGALSISELAAPYDMTLMAVSKHVSVLEGAGLVTKEKRGRAAYVHLKAESLRSAATWIAHYHRFWEDGLDALGDVLNRMREDG